MSPHLEVIQFGGDRCGRHRRESRDPPLACVRESEQAAAGEEKAAGEINSYQRRVQSHRMRLSNRRPAVCNFLSVANMPFFRVTVCADPPGWSLAGYPGFCRRGSMQIAIAIGRSFILTSNRCSGNVKVCNSLMRQQSNARKFLIDGVSSIL